MNDLTNNQYNSVMVTDFLTDHTVTAFLFLLKGLLIKSCIFNKINIWTSLRRRKYIIYKQIQNLR